MSDTSYQRLRLARWVLSVEAGRSITMDECIQRLADAAIHAAIARCKSRGEDPVAFMAEARRKAKEKSKRFAEWNGELVLPAGSVYEH